VSVCVGVRTGRCVPSDIDPTKKTCEVIAWCPVERDELPLYDIYRLISAVSLEYKCNHFFYVILFGSLTV